MPLTILVTELDKRTSGRTFRTDIPPKDTKVAGMTVAELFYEFEV